MPMKKLDIGSPTRRCCKTGRELKPGDVYYAALVHTDDGLQRLDYAPEAWSGPPEGAIGFWRGRIPLSRQPRRRQIDDNLVMERFLTLEADADSTNRVLRYILALHLMRRRLLRLVRIESRGDDDFIRVRTTREPKGEWVVWCPVLSEEEVSELEHRLPELLSDGDTTAEPPRSDQEFAA